MAWRLPLALTVAAALALSSTAEAQDTLDQAKALYSSAAYDEALAMLDRLDQGSVEEVGIEVALYRMFCYLVLDRTDEASEVIDEIVMADPFYIPASDKASPRIRAIFEEGRRSALPRVVWRMYAEAKDAFAAKNQEAGEQFDRLVALLGDPVLAGDSTFADLRILVSGFRDLALASGQEDAAQPSSASQSQDAHTTKAEPGTSPEAPVVAPKERPAMVMPRPR